MSSFDNLICISLPLYAQARFDAYAHFTGTPSEEGVNCSCERNSPSRATYNYTSQILTVGLEQSFPEVSLIEMSLCKSGTVENYLNQTCSSFDVDVSLIPQAFSDLILIAFPPVCNACVPALDYTTYMGMDFSLNGEKVLDVA